MGSPARQGTCNGCGRVGTITNYTLELCTFCNTKLRLEGPHMEARIGRELLARLDRNVRRQRKHKRGARNV